MFGKYSPNTRFIAGYVSISVRYDLDIDDVVESQSRRFQDALDIVEGLPDLRDSPDGTVPVRAAGPLARDVEIVARIHPRREKAVAARGMVGRSHGTHSLLRCERSETSSREEPRCRAIVDRRTGVLSFCLGCFLLRGAQDSAESLPDDNFLSGLDRHGNQLDMIGPLALLAIGIAFANGRHQAGIVRAQALQ